MTPTTAHASVLPAPRREARCGCGALRLSTHGEPVRISVCHCIDCQRRTGSPFGMQARWPAEQVVIEGEARVYSRLADSGKRIDFHFCPDCGSTLYYRLEVDPDRIAVPVGAFADPGFPPPTVSVYESRRHAWVVLPEDTERLD